MKVELDIIDGEKRIRVTNLIGITPEIFCHSKGAEVFFQLTSRLRVIALGIDPQDEEAIHQLIQEPDIEVQCYGKTIFNNPTWNANTVRRMADETVTLYSWQEPDEA